MPWRARWGVVGTNVGLPIAGTGREVVSRDSPLAAIFIVGRQINPRINLGMSTENVDSVVRRRKQILTFSLEQLKYAWCTLVEARQALKGVQPVVREQPEGCMFVRLWRWSVH
jgi:hypothetical protein